MSIIEDRVCEKIQKRAAFGLNKYGVTLAEAIITELELLQHAQDEAMDLCNYLETRMEQIKSKQSAIR